MLRAARQLLDRAAVQVAACEIHGREGALRPQQLVDQTDAFEEFRPVHIREQSHARDDVAHRDVRRRLTLMLLEDDLLGRRAL